MITNTELIFIKEVTQAIVNSGNPTHENVKESERVLFEVTEILEEGKEW